MQQDFSNGFPASPGQLGYIKGLVRKGLMDPVKLSELSKEEASELITRATEATPGPVADAKTNTVGVPTGLNSQRFGMCVKLIWNEFPDVLANKKHEKQFRNAVVKLYNIVTELEIYLNGILANVK